MATLYISTTWAQRYYLSVCWASLPLRGDQKNISLISEPLGQLDYLHVSDSFDQYSHVQWSVSLDLTHPTLSEPDVYFVVGTRYIPRGNGKCHRDNYWDYHRISGNWCATRKKDLYLAVIEMFNPSWVYIYNACRPSFTCCLMLRYWMCSSMAVVSYDNILSVPMTF